MHDLERLFVEKITAGLKRKSISDPAKYAELYRIMGKPFPGKWTFKYHPWLLEMHKSKAEFNVGQKAAQCGYTECVLNIVFYKIDIENIDCLYVLPAKTPDASDFSASRFDPALELSPHLGRLFNDVKNVGHKRAGYVNLYIRGSRSRAGLKSVPAGLIVLDELDEFTQKNIPLAFERASGQKEKQIWMVSTPTIDTIGINKYYTQSTQEIYFFRCTSCSKYTHLIFPECLEITGENLDDISLDNSYIKCKECKSKLDHRTKFDWLSPKSLGGTGDWIPEHTHRDIRGFHVSQLYSSTVSPVDLARAYLKAINDPAEEQTFYNDKLGVPHVVAGARLTEHQINSCKGNYLNGEIKRHHHMVTMGIDVGKHLHYEITDWELPYYLSESIDLHVQSRARVLEAGKLLNFGDLDNLMSQWRVVACVIDANPERRSAFEFASRFWGHVKCCFYGAGIRSRQINETKTSNQDEPTITVDRTQWLDLSLGRFRSNTITIPSNIPREYVDQLQTLTRVYEKDKDGNAYGRYIKGEGQDHYAHARNYNEIALSFAAHISNPQSIRSPI